MTSERNIKIQDFKIEISTDDIYQAMKEIPGYIDITVEDFKEIYRHAYGHAFNKMAFSVTAGDIMSRNVITVPGQTSLQDVASIMAPHAVSGVPVMDNKNLIGILTEKDFLCRLGGPDTQTFMKFLAHGLKQEVNILKSIHGHKAEDIMSSPVITVGKKTAVIEIVDIFDKKNINRVPVIDTESQMIGIVTRADIVKAPLRNFQANPTY